MLGYGANTVGSQASLLGRFLAGDIQYVMAAAAYVSSDLQEQRRFSDAGIATDEYHHSGQRTAAEHTVEFFNAGRQALSFISADLSDRDRPCRGPLTPTPVAV